MGERIERSADGIIGRCLGEFVVRERLGEGGGGTVYLAEQPLLGRDAVIKVLHAQHAGEPARIQRFLREARLASRLDHPYAAHIYAFGAEPDGLLWIAMERVRGTPLDQWLVLQGPLPLDRFVPLLDRICEVVHTAHQQGIIHRDLKPANVMVLSRAGRLLPKLIDFGIAKLVDEPSVPQDADSGPRRVVELERTMQAGHAATAGPLGPIGPIGQVGPMGVALPASAAGPTISAAPTGMAPGVPTLPSTDQPITRRGLVTGSPHFMAPEQWVNAADVDARTDLYALGALAYEALTGRHAFTGATIRELARAHAKASPPSLGAHFPPALDAVLARALAKRPADRFATALDLAAAFRAAAGLAEPTGLPELDETLQASVLAGAPQPLAEAVARLGAARNAHQAREAMWQVRRVAARYLGLVALAARSRLGGEQRDAEPLATLLRTLRQRGLEDEDWVTLAAETCRPFAARPEGFPIPEMVSFFFPSSEPGASGPAAPAVEASLAMEATAQDTADPFAPLLAWGSPSDLGGSEEEVRQQLGDGLRALEGLLRGLDFLADYPLVVHRGGGNERWTGVRRSSRALLPVRGQPLPEGQP
ncbi:MAG TPA: serine/threonine-protein kinase, partial [Polyangia bacterium]|nr:serine/threonine-protein kinase [Polyangia bacterium]